MTYDFSTKPASILRPPRRAVRPDLHPAEARAYTTRLLREQKVTPLADRVIDLLAVAGVLGERQIQRLIPLSSRSLRRYYALHLLDRLPTHGLNLARFGFARTERVYALGMAGLLVAERRASRGAVPSGYLGLGVRQVMHDLLANEVAIRLSQRALEAGLAPTWRSKYEATVRDERQRARLEPDAHLAWGDQQVVIEYHHEDSARRAARKLGAYEQLYREGHWRESWESDRFPLVLVAFTHRAVATGYLAAVQEQRAVGLRGRYLGKPWASFQRNDDAALWQDFQTGRLVNVLTGEEVG